jgi:hypothetical protein
MAARGRTASQVREGRVCEARVSCAGMNKPERTDDVTASGGH